MDIIQNTIEYTTDPYYTDTFNSFEKINLLDIEINEIYFVINYQATKFLFIYKRQEKKFSMLILGKFGDRLNYDKIYQMFWILLNNFFGNQNFDKDIIKQSVRFVVTKGFKFDGLEY